MGQVVAVIFHAAVYYTAVCFLEGFVLFAIFHSLYMYKVHKIIGIRNLSEIFDNILKRKPGTTLLRQFRVIPSEIYRFTVEYAFLFPFGWRKAFEEYEPYKVTRYEINRLVANKAPEYVSKIKDYVDTSEIWAKSKNLDDLPVESHNRPINYGE